MARYLLIIVLALATSGCLRMQFDRCDDQEPHPDCALLDGATRDGGADAGT